MSIDCYCDYGDPAFYWARIRKARKKYQCYDCSGRIKPGEKYEYVSAKWEGYISTMRTCERCYDIRIWVKNNVPCFCYMHGDLEETAAYAVEDACWRAPNETVGLTFGLRRRFVVRDRWNTAQRV